MEIFKEYRFEAAHRLPNTPNVLHKCRKLHGHSYRVELHVTGEQDQDAGWVVDFGEITRAWEPIYNLLDHSYLNEIKGLQNPTSENLAIWIWQKINLKGLSAVVVRETCTSGCIYRGEE